jgi:hypothetical protein
MTSTNEHRRKLNPESFPKSSVNAGRRKYRKMIESHFIHWWLTLVGSRAMIGIILIAFGITLRIVKPADAMKHIGTVLGLVIALMLIPGIVMSAWSGMSLWQKSALVAIVVGILLPMRPRRHPWQRK